MKAIFLAIAVTTTAPADVFASGYKLLPNSYANKYCELRDMGVSRKEAIDIAVRENLFPGKQENIVIDGKAWALDVVEASNAVKYRCPAYLTQ